MTPHRADWPLPDFTRLRNCAGDGSPVPRSTPDPKGPMMTTISDQDRTEAQAMFETFHGGGTLIGLSDDVAPRWLAVRDHVLAVHECPTVPVWRPVIDGEEIQAGWAVRSRYRGRELGWGVAHHQDSDGDWHTEAGTTLTFARRGWTYETTAPLPEPEPWPEGLVMVLAEVISNEPGTVENEARAVLDLLAARGLIERPKAGA